MTARSSSTPARETSFFVGGHDLGSDCDTGTVGRTYVRCLRPAGGAGERTPVVMVPGASQTGSVFETTADGRPGWASVLRDHGHPVYAVDPPASGRSPHHEQAHGPLHHYSRVAFQRFFTAPSRFRLWPRATAHTQWPGDGGGEDPAFERLCRSAVGYLPDLALLERLTADALLALLERIGPSVLLTHSQAGPAGWLTADRRPSLVRAVVAVEPTGPPFFSVTPGAPSRRPVVVRRYGITTNPLTYRPALRTDPGPTPFDRSVAGMCVPGCAVPPALPRLARTPVLVVTSESSYHAHYDELTVEYLRGAGVPVEFRRLDDVGVRGNGHMMMLERNSDEVAGQILAWLDART